MLRILARMAGVRVVALAYLAACLAPSAAMAFGDGSAICLEELTEQAHAVGGRGHVHVHPDGTVHYHADHKAPDSARGDLAKKNNGGAPAHSHDDGDCCGLFGFSAVLPGLDGPMPTVLSHDIRQFFVADCLVGCAPRRIDRPPITSSPM